MTFLFLFTWKSDDFMRTELKKWSSYLMGNLNDCLMHLNFFFFYPPKFFQVPVWDNRWDCPGSVKTLFLISLHNHTILTVLSFMLTVVRLSSKKILRKKCTLVRQLPQAYLNAKDTEIPYSLRLCPFYIKIEIFCPSKRLRNFWLTIWLEILQILSQFDVEARGERDRGL